MSAEQKGLNSSTSGTHTAGETETQDKQVGSTRSVSGSFSVPSACPSSCRSQQRYLVWLPTLQLLGWSPGTVGILWSRSQPGRAAAIRSAPDQRGSRHTLLNHIPHTFSHVSPHCTCRSSSMGGPERRRVVSAGAAASAGGNDDVQGAMLEPSVANTPWVGQQAAAPSRHPRMHACMYAEVRD